VNNRALSPAADREDFDRYPGDCVRPVTAKSVAPFSVLDCSRFVLLIENKT